MVMGEELGAVCSGETMLGSTGRGKAKRLVSSVMV